MCGISPKYFETLSPLRKPELDRKPTQSTILSNARVFRENSTEAFAAKGGIRIVDIMQLPCKGKSRAYALDKTVVDLVVGYARKSIFHLRTTHAWELRRHLVPPKADLRIVSAAAGDLLNVLR